MAKRRFGARRNREELTHGQSMELWLGPRNSDGLQHFRDDGHAEDCYWLHRERVLQEFGGQCWACRKFEAGKSARDE